MSTQHPSQLICWLLDVRSLWPGDHISSSATAALSLLTSDERAKTLSKHFIQDARMALGSALLKRLFTARYLGSGGPWAAMEFPRRGDPVHGKPAVREEWAGRGRWVDFNVSHQAGLVALVGVVEELEDGGRAREGGKRGTEVGVDITCVNERNDCRTIDRERFDGWVDTFSEFFSADECWDMKYNIDPSGLPLPDGTVLSAKEIESTPGRPDRCLVKDQTFSVRRADGSNVALSSDLIVDAKLRRFYAFYCYKEAYIKMSGEGMMADWLQDLEFRNVKSPKPGTVAGVWGGSMSDAEAYLNGVEQTDVALEIRGREEDFMIGVAVRPGEGFRGRIPMFERIDLEKDIMAAAEGR
ncbi:hypothetical protein P152DRAFT_125938 [Eremomyces bilateralis CBS 781.70]|uniref:holo-[acyl-carrier-protein] synthase n=1 Tax=Eremomyces bilateralis CBS 781.70 TaxID=1392243 RepID=A0A6G1GEP5_9PEZI|nr:uncharacterized protein P152DRAFT_125938 [Eremomyces bilateralis CBS 781.70]KAF1816482.1 hypothetical protein P152DRAFT_125938 [Eremomyces bilateralis CBS 781.70]